MAKLFASIFVLSTFLSFSSGCIVRTRSRGRAVARSCPPAHHWDGYACVHNGRARGHNKRR